MTLPYREKVIACERGGTFKYFLARDHVFPTWNVLGQAYGPVHRNPTMHTIEIRGVRLLFRSTMLGNPITVFRLPDCTAADVGNFHDLIGFSEVQP
jgi:hypothetical protein